MQIPKLLSSWVVVSLACAAAGFGADAEARLAVRKPTSSPTPISTPVPTSAPTPTSVAPTATPVAPPPEGDPCQSGLRAASASLASSTHRSLGACLTPAIDCLLDPATLDACCSESASRCRRQLATIGDAGAEFERQVARRSCADLSLDVILAPDGLGFDEAVGACGRLDPPVSVADTDDLARCLRRLIVEDVVHRMVAVEHPRALEAVFCMGVEEEIPGVQLDDPATCVGASLPPAPTPSPTPDPAVTPDPNQTPDPSATPTPTPASPSSCSTVTLTARSSFDETNFPDVSGLSIEVRYPGSKVQIPGFGGEPTVAARVTNLTGVAGGLFNVADQDDPNQGPVGITVGLVAIPGPIPSGDFARIELDCVEGAAAPSAGEFGCLVDASTLLGATVDATCSVAVALQ